VFWIRVLGARSNGDLLIENLHDIGKKKVDHVQTVIESDLVYPLLRGRDVKAWAAAPSAFIIMTQDPRTRVGIPEREMKRKYPKTFAYLRRFETVLRARSGYRRYFDPTDPFYSIYNVNERSIATWKTVWREQSSMFQVAAMPVTRPKAIVADHKLMVIACNSELENYYLTALLNSSPSRLIVASYVISTSTSTHVLEFVKIPKFASANKTHLRLAKMSKKCHDAIHADELDGARDHEQEIDELAANVWGLTKAELRAVTRALEREIVESAEPPDDE
jgi:hypothetical protein